MEALPRAPPAGPRHLHLPVFMARSLLLVAATVLLTLAAVHLLVRSDLVSASLWSYYPVLLAAALALLFGLKAVRRQPGAARAAGGEGR